MVLSNIGIIPSNFRENSIDLRSQSDPRFDANKRNLPALSRGLAFAGYELYPDQIEIAKYSTLYRPHTTS